MIVLSLICFLFGMGVFTYAMALLDEAEKQAPYYVKLGTWGAMLSISATFLAVVYACTRELVGRR
jgi:hypothetical protein